MVRDILVIRLSKQYNNITDKELDYMHVSLYNKFINIYNVIVFIGENETNKTELEIIKYNGR